MALSYKLTMPKLGNISASSLVKSASTLTNELNSYNDYVQKLNFTQDPTDQNFNAYVNYLQGRISTLSATGSITNIHKAAELQNEITSAYKTNTTFNIDTITTQMMASGNTSDQQKLDYLTQNVLTNPIVQSDASLYQKYMNQAYSFQQSIALQNQTQQNAAISTYNLNEAATKAGYTNAINWLESQYKEVNSAFQEGKDISGALASMKTALINNLSAAGGEYAQYAQQLKSDNSVMTLGNMAAAVLNAEKLYYQNGANALTNLATGVGISNSPDAQAFVQKLWDINHDVYKLPTAKGDMTQSQIDAWVQAGANANITGTVINSKTGQPEQRMFNNPDVTGFKMEKINGQWVPETTYGSPGQAAPGLQPAYKNQQGSLSSKLAALGLAPTGNKARTKYVDSNGNYNVMLTAQSAKWMGINPVNYQGGATSVTMIPTLGGKGFQFVLNGHVYGISLDANGKAATYQQGDNGAWQQIGSQAGFNAHTTANGIPTQAPAAQNNLVPAPYRLQGGVGPSAYATNNNGYQMTQRVGGGFDFTHNGKAISAATYAMGTNTQFRTLLQNMANRGDTGAKSALGFVGNDYGYNPNAIGNNGNLYNALTWGSGHSFHGASTPSVSGGSLTLPSGMRL